MNETCYIIYIHAYLHRLRFAMCRFTISGKVMGKTNLDLPTLKRRKYIEASDSVFWLSIAMACPQNIGKTCRCGDTPLAFRQFLCHLVKRLECWSLLVENGESQIFADSWWFKVEGAKELNVDAPCDQGWGVSNLLRCLVQNTSSHWSVWKDPTRNQTHGPFPKYCGQV